MNIRREKDKELNTWIWKADFRYKKKRYRIKAFNKESLDRKIIDIKSNADHPVLKVKFSLCVKERIKEFDLSDANGRRKKKVLEMFQTFIKDKNTIEITTSDYYDYVQFRRSQNKKISNVALNLELTCINSCLKASTNYFAGLEKFLAPRVPWQKVNRQRRRRVIYEDEKQKLLAYMRFEGTHYREKKTSIERRGLFADMFELALNTAMRWGEIAQLRFSYINFNWKIIQLPKEITKTGTGRDVYLNTRAIGILEKRQKLQINEFVFPNLVGDSYEKNYYYYLRHYAQKCKLDFSLKGFTPHSTRHTAISEMLLKSGDFAGAQAQAGHSDATMTALYAHARGGQMHALVENLVEK